MKFTELLKEIQVTYPNETREFHFIATRYYLNIISREELVAFSVPSGRRNGFGKPYDAILTEDQVEEIITNR